jgi:hypothetical protein
MILVTATAVREGKSREVPLAELVPGDIVQLAGNHHSNSGTSASWVRASKAVRRLPWSSRPA